MLDFVFIFHFAFLNVKQRQSPRFLLGFLEIIPWLSDAENILTFKQNKRSDLGVKTTIDVELYSKL